MSSSDKNPQIFVAKLSSSVREKDLDYEFRRYGPIRNIQLKKGYAFIEYEDHRDALEAIRDMDQRRFEGQRIIVQKACKHISIIIYSRKKERQGQRPTFKRRLKRPQRQKRW